MIDLTPPSGRLVRFGLFQLDVATGELLRSGRRIRLQEQPFKVLTLLLERPSELITREELRQKLWPADTFVDFDDGLNAAVKKLRYALGDAADNPTFIETIPRRGYRFIAPVVVEANAENVRKYQVPSPESDEGHHGVATRVEGPSSQRKALWLGVPAITIVAVIAVVLIASRDSSPSGAELSPIRSIVILPLKNLSNDPEQQYFADGMTEELITRLAGIAGLRVISRTSAMKFRDTEKLLPRIASELKVDAVVTGSVLHSGNRVRITAQLLHAASDRLLWAESYEGDERDVLQLQNEVAQQIADEIRLELRPAGAATARRARPIDPEAHRAYFLGRYRWHTRRNAELGKAVEDFKRAIAIDPSYARAYAGLADVYLVMPLLMQNLRSGDVLPKAKEAVEKALELDPTLPEAHNSNAYVKMYLDWDFAAAERGFRKAIELNPNYATAHQWYAELLSLQGRHDEARTEIGIALELDPLSAVMHHQAGQCYNQARRYDEALQEYEDAIAIDPSFAKTSAGGKSRAYARKGMPQQSVEALISPFRNRSSIPWVIAREKAFSELERVFAHGGLRAFRLKYLEFNLFRSEIHPYYAAVLYAAVGQDDQAIQWLNKAYKQRDYGIFDANVDPEWDHLRSDPRFIAVLEKVGLNRATNSVQLVPRVHRETRRRASTGRPRSVVLKTPAVVAA